MMLASVVRADPPLDYWYSLGPQGGDRCRICIDPVDPQILYALGNSPYKSTDGGENWFCIDNTNPESYEVMGLFAFAIGIDPMENETLYLGTLKGVWKSLDGGELWVTAGTGFSEDDQFIRSVVVDVADPLNVYATVSRVYPYESVGIVKEMDAAIYRSLDGGSTWEPFHTGIPEPFCDVTAIYQNPSSHELFAATYGDGVFRYNESLGSWVPTNSGLSPPHGLFITELAFDPNDGDVLYACTKKDWIYKTTDGGETWWPSPAPERLKAAYPPLAYFAVVDPNNSETVWVSAAPGTGWKETSFYWADGDQDLGGLFVSEDGGASWELTTWTGILPDAGPYSMSVDPSEVVGEPPLERSKTYYLAGGGIKNVYKSTDGCVSGEVTTVGLHALNSNSLKQHPEDGSILMTSNEGAVEISFDRGGNWGYLTPAVEQGTSYVWDVAADPLDPGFILYATGNPDWDRPSQKGLYRADLAIIDPHIQFVDGPGEQLPSTRGIGIWRFYPFENGTIYLATQNDGVRKSEDFGVTWTGVGSGLTRKSVTSLVFDADQEPLVAGTRDSDGNGQYTFGAWDQDGEAGAVYKWDSLLQTWRRVSEELIGSAVFSVVNGPGDPEKVYAASMEGVFFSPDGGETWEARHWGLPRPDGYFKASDIVIHPEDPDRLFVESWLFGVYASSDGGKHWTPYRRNLHRHAMQKLIFDREFPNILYSATVGASIMSCRTGAPPVVDSVAANGVPLSDPYVVSLTEEELIEIRVEGHDPDGETVTYSAFLNDAPVPAPWEVPEPDETYTFDPETHRFRWTPQHGIGELAPFTLLLKVFDGAMAAYAEVAIDIEAIHPPEVDWITAGGALLAEPYEASVKEEELLEIRIEASDADGDELFYSAFVNGQPVPAPTEVSGRDESYTFDPETRTFRWVPPLGYSEWSPYQLNFTVTDGRFTISPIVMFTVEPIHSPEVVWIKAGGAVLSEPYETSVVEEELLEIQIKASDADGDELFYSAFVNGQPVPEPSAASGRDESYTFDPETRTFRWAPPHGYSEWSPFQLNFEITDGRFTIAPIVMFAVEPIHSPEIDWIKANGVTLSEPYGATVMEEALILVQIRAVDADGDGLSYRAELNGEEVPAPWDVPDPNETYTFNPTNRTFRWRPPLVYSLWSPYLLYFEITDGRFTIYALVEIFVEPAFEDCSIHRIQNPSHPDFIPEWSQVFVQGVIVTAVAPPGYFFVEEPGAGPWSGIMIHDPDQQAPGDLAAGDELMVGGLTQEESGMTRIQAAVVVRTDTGRPVPGPEAAAPCDIATGGILAEAYEGGLVRVEGVEVTLENPDAPGDLGEYEVAGCLRVDDLMMADYEPREGDILESITGVLYYSEDNFKIAPRHVGDLVFAECWDGDADSFADYVCGGDDCDDADPDVNPGAGEVCHNGIDDDCDGFTDEHYGDVGPLGEGDCMMSAADLNLAINGIRSAIDLTGEEAGLIDVAPVRICEGSTLPITVAPNPDGRLDAADLTVLLQAASGYLEIVPQCTRF